MTARKLTPIQRETLLLIADGWELYSSGGLAPYYGIQQGGAGYGGSSRSVHANTVYALDDRNLIINAGRGPGLGTVYKLTAAGEDLVAELKPGPIFRCPNGHALDNQAGIAWAGLPHCLTCGAPLEEAPDEA